MRRFGVGFVFLISSSISFRISPVHAEDAAVTRGRYLVKIAGCNDCHTSGYAQKKGDVPEDEWLMGDRIGWRGPWGTTYATNLRQYFGLLSEDQWIRIAKSLSSRPPMPSYVLNEMAEEDLRAIYLYLRSVGSKGEAAPEFVPPEIEPSTPFISFIPVVPTNQSDKR